MSKTWEPLQKFWPIILAVAGLLFGAGRLASSLEAGLEADRRLFHERLAAQQKATDAVKGVLTEHVTRQDDYQRRLTVLLEGTIPDYRERLTRAEERIEALRQAVGAAHK